MFRKRKIFKTLISAIVLAVVVFMLYGCGSKTTVAVPVLRSEVKKQSGVLRALDNHYRRWQGTRYKLGGYSRAGIDCSGFTKITYNRVFGRNLPRTTTEQMKVGRNVSKSSLRPGDLVFFKTGIRQKHVGVYYKDGIFIHASLSRGVMMSEMENKYWRKRFIKAGRL